MNEPKRKGPKKPAIKLPERVNGRVPKPDQETVNKLVKLEEAARGYTICGGWKPVKGGVCCKRPIKGRSRCKDCGGRTKRGVDSPRFKHGLFSKQLEGNVATNYHRILEDAALLDLKEHVAVATSRMMEQISDMNVGMIDTGDEWKALLELASELDFTIKEVDSKSDYFKVIEDIAEVKAIIPSIEKAKELAKLLPEVAKRTIKSRRKWTEIIETQDHIRKLVDSERKHRIREKESMSIEAFAVNVQVLSEAIKLFFPEEEVAKFREFVRKNIIGSALRQLPEITEAEVIEER